MKNRYRLPTCLSAVVVTENTERMAIAEGPVLDQSVWPEHLIELCGDVTATGAGLHEFDSSPMDVTVDVPKSEVFITSMAKEHGALQGGVIPGSGKRAHRKCIVVDLGLLSIEKNRQRMIMN